MKNMEDMFQDYSQFPNHIRKFEELRFKVQNYFHDSIIYLANKGVLIDKVMVTINPELSEQDKLDINFRINYFNRVMYLYSKLENLIQSNHGTNENLNRLIKDLDIALSSELNGARGMHEEIRPIDPNEEASYSSFTDYINNLDLNDLVNYGATNESSSYYGEC